MTRVLGCSEDELQGRSLGGEALKNLLIEPDGPNKDGVALSSDPFL